MKKVPWLVARVGIAMIFSKAYLRGQVVSDESETECDGGSFVKGTGLPVP